MVSVVALLDSRAERIRISKELELRLAYLSDDVWRLLGDGVHSPVVTYITRNPQVIAQARRKQEEMAALAPTHRLTLGASALLGVAQHKDGDALSTTRKLTQQYPDDQRTWMFRAAVQSDLADKYDSLGRARSVEGEYTAEALTAMASIDYTVGRQDKAEAHFIEACSMGCSASARSNYSVFLHKTHRASEAEAKALEALDCDPFHAHANHMLALLYYNRGFLEKARYHAEQAMSLHPEWPLAIGMKAIIIASHDPIGAEFLFLDSIRLDSRNPTVRRNYADLLLGAARFFEAREQAEACIRHSTDRADPDYLQACRIVTQCSAELKEFPAAVVAAQRVVALAPEDSDAWNNLAGLQYHIGEHEEAERSYMQAILLNPSNEEYPANLERLYAAMRRKGLRH